MEKVKTTINSFEMKMTDIREGATFFKRSREQAEQEALEWKKKEEMKLQELTRLNRIAYFARLPYNIMEWHSGIEKYREHVHNKKTYVGVWELETSMLDFAIYLKEDHTMKRDKYLVEVVARHRTLGTSPREIHGGYTDFNYGKDKYMKSVKWNVWEPIKGQEMEKKFAKLEDARKFVEEWKERLFSDHLAEIEFEQALRQECIDSGFQYDADRRF